MMRKSFLFMAMLMLSLVAQAQQAGVSPVGSLNIRKEVKPAILNLVEGSVHFIDQTGNNAIDANEQCKIVFKVRNDGTGDGLGCEAKITAMGTTSAITVNSKKLPTIAVGQTVEVELPVVAGMNTKDGAVDFAFRVDEPNGFGTEEVQMQVNTKAFVAPMLRIVDYAVTGSGSGRLEKKRPFNLQLVLQNTDYGRAENVYTEIYVPEGVYLLEGDLANSFANMEAGDAKSLEYQLIVNQNYDSTTIPVIVNIKERYGRYAENRTINLQLNQDFAGTKISVSEVEQKRKDIQLATLGSDVDKNIPVAKVKAQKTFAVVIANENYQQVAAVPYALNDGRIFRQYCQQTLGIPEANIHYVPDATGNNIRQQVNWLKKVITAYNGEAKVIFYYAGHGVPDEAAKTAFLLPVDGSGSDVATGYKLDELYKELGSLPSRSVTVLLDACFSGAKREEGMLASARGVAVKVQSGQPVGNMVVFSAATGDETAYPNRSEGHGMFTYYLLKKLQDTAGDVTFSELGDYIRDNVSQQSIVLNGKSQTPTVIPSASLGTNWQQWKLK